MRCATSAVDERRSADLGGNDLHVQQAKEPVGACKACRLQLWRLQREMPGLIEFPGKEVGRISLQERNKHRIARLALHPAGPYRHRHFRACGILDASCIATPHSLVLICASLASSTDYGAWLPIGTLGYLSHLLRRT